MTPNIYSFINLLTISKLANLNTYIERVTTCLEGDERKKSGTIIIDVALLDISNQL